MVKQKHQLFVALLAGSDALCVACAAFAAWLVRKVLIPLPDGWPFWPEHWETYFKEPLILFAAPLTVYALWAFKMYRPKRDRSLWSEYGQILQASVVSLAAMVVVLWAVGNQAIGHESWMGSLSLWGTQLDANRVQLAALAGFLPSFLILHRTGVRLVLRHLRARGKNLRHVAIIGVGRIGRIACQTIDRNSWTGLNVCYFISHEEENTRTEVLERPVLGGLRDLEHTLERCKVDAVYIAIPTAMSALVPGLLQRLERFAVDVRIVPDVNPRYLPQSMVMSELDGMPILSYRESPLHGVGGMTKRAVDICGAAVALVLFSPVMIAAAVAVRLSGPGPVIFKQPRVSLNGEVFNIYKFRTMQQVEDEAGEGADAAAAVQHLDVDEESAEEDGTIEVPTEWTRPDDPRITRIGRLLRRTSLDELPQLLNVLSGEMSLVGPRPERPELIERFREDWRGYMLRQHVKAGMTGWAQVNGLRGNTSLRRRLKYDLFYVRNWSLWLDLRILVMTVVRGFLHENAR